MHFKNKNTQQEPRRHVWFLSFYCEVENGNKIPQWGKSEKTKQTTPKTNNTKQTPHTKTPPQQTNEGKQQHKSVFKYIHSNKPQTGAGATNKTVQRVNMKHHVLGIYQETKLFHLCSNRVGHTLSIKAGGEGTGAGRQNVRYHAHYYQHCMPPFCTWVGNNPNCRSPS